MQDLFRNRFRIADEERTGRSELGVEVRASHRWPSALPANLSEASRIAGKELVFGRRRSIGDIASRMNADLELLWRMAGAQTSPVVAIDQRPETVRLAADNRDHQRQPEGAGANERAGRAADTKPNRQQLLQRAGVNSLPGKRSAMFP